MDLRVGSRLWPAVALAWFALPFMGSNASAQDRAVRTVLAVHWGSEDFPATPLVNAGIRAVLGSRPDIPIDYFTEYLQSARLPAEQASLALREYIRRKYRGRRIDVVIAISDPALRFVLADREALFADAPIIYSGVAVPDEAVRRAGGGLTAVTRGIAYVETLKLALELHPSTERVFVVATSRDTQNVESVRAELDGFSQRVKLAYIDAETVPGLLAAVKAVPAGSLILYIWYDRQDHLGKPVYPDEIARLIVSAAPVPVYGTNEFYLGTGVVGGVVRGTRETAIRVAEMAREILGGRRAQDIPIESARLVPVFDWRQVQRWRIDLSRLPPGSEIRFRTATAWESYRPYIIAIVVVIVAQSVLITGLLTHRARRRRAEDTLRTREATLRTSYERIRQLAGRLIHAQEAARADIARDLHDDVCQDLVGVSMAVGKLKRSSGRIEDVSAQQALFKLQRWALAIAEGVRRLSHDLHPATLQLLGLAAALKAHCTEIEKRHDAHVIFRTEGDLGQIQPEVALCLFRIGQEALRNGIVHGHARRLAVSVTRSGGHIELTVTDDGRGFDFDALRPSGAGLGLVSMEERAHALGGDVHIVSHAGEGTTIRVRIPADVGITATWEPEAVKGQTPPRV